MLIYLHPVGDVRNLNYLMIHLVVFEMKLLGLLDVEVQFFPVAFAPIADQCRLRGQGFQLVKKLGAWNGVGSQTH